MGFFDGLFKNPLGTIANTVAAPFKAGGNILSGKGNIGDLLSIGSLFMPGGNLTGNFAKMGTSNFGLSSLLGSQGLGGFGDISKWQTKDFLNFLPMLTQGGSQQSGGGGSYIPSNLTDMANQISMLDMATLLQRLPQRNAALDRAYQGLSQSGTRATANSLGNQAQARGVEAGKANAGTLQRQGYASSVSDAARLQGRNQGTQQANSLMASIMSPQNLAQNALLQSQVYSPANLQGNGLQSLLSIQNANNGQRQANANYENTRPNNPLETLLGILPGVAGAYLGNQQQGMQMPQTASSNSGPRLQNNSFQTGVNNTLSGYNPQANYGITQPKGWFDTLK